MAVPTCEADVALTALQAWNVPRLAVPKEIAARIFLALACSVWEKHKNSLTRPKRSFSRTCCRKTVSIQILIFVVFGTFCRKLKCEPVVGELVQQNIRIYRNCTGHGTSFTAGFGSGCPLATKRPP